MKLELLPTAPLYWMQKSLRDRGIAQTTKVALSFLADLSFDLVNGTDTLRRVEMSSLAIASAHRANAARYGATKARPFVEVMKRLDLPRGSVLVDIGSGKGRVLMVGAECGLFTKVVGIEFSSELCAIARKNIDRFAQKRMGLAPIEIVETDAVEYRFDADQNVFFMFDPFDDEILERVLQNLDASLAAAPRKIWLVYHSAVHHDAIEKSGLFDDCKSVQVRGSDFNVYTRSRSHRRPCERSSS